MSAVDLDLDRSPRCPAVASGGIDGVISTAAGICAASKVDRSVTVLGAGHPVGSKSGTAKPGPSWTGVPCLEAERPVVWGSPARTPRSRKVLEGTVGSPRIWAATRCRVLRCFEGDPCEGVESDPCHGGHELGFLRLWTMSSTVPIGAYYFGAILVFFCRTKHEL